jgi:hypothetical protein
VSDNFEWGATSSTPGVDPPNWSMAPPPSAPPVAPAGPPAPRRRGRSVRTVAIATVTAGALALVGVGVASAQSSGSTTTTPSTVAPSTPAPATKPAAGPRGLPGKGGFPGPGGLGGFGAGGAIRGEFVRPNGRGGYQTVDTQIGVVQPGVSTTSIAVKSADGVTKTYAVTTNTVVNSGRDGIGSVKAGDTVAIEAVVPAGGGTPEAASVVDRTSLGSIQGHWRPATPATPPTTTG